MISVQFGQANILIKDQYITNVEWKLPGSPQPTRFSGKADLVITSDFVCLKLSTSTKVLFRIKVEDILGTRRNSKLNHFTININGNGYIKLSSNKPLVTIADLLDSK